MIAHLKRAACRTASATGLFGVSRALSAHLPRILMYHGFCGTDQRFDDCTDTLTFRRQLAHIKKHYRPAKLSELGRRLAADEPLPDRTIAITIDDGYENFARFAVPLLAEFDIPATLFVVSDLPDSGQWLWTDKFKYLLARANDSIPTTIAALKQMPTGDRDEQLADLAAELNISIPDHAPARHALLGWKALEQLVAAGLIEIGAHTRNHPILAHVPSEQAWDQISGSRRALEQKLAAPVTTFCYPNGKPGDFLPEQTDMVRKAGFICATASHIGWVSPASNRFALPRIGGDGGDMLQFRKYVDGFEYLQRRAAGIPSA